ncbi:hypothetical protein BC834DRAFT_1045168 [Gloeopeniophorella convolvens]|nr:hypothetical protein BC834DRAFT_1045168 [Gloeopeniophorella convolvens]
MSLVALSTELIEQIAAHLNARDLLALKHTSRRTHAVVAGSLLLTYLYRTARAGLHDPLAPASLAALPIPARLAALARWEAAWGPRLPAHLARPRQVLTAERDLFGPFFLSDGFLFAVDWQGAAARPPALLFADLRAPHGTAWQRIDYPPGSIAITQAFAVRADDLVVSVLSLPQDGGGGGGDGTAPPRTVLRFMSLATRGAHPHAARTDVPLATALPVSMLDVRADVLGAHIVLVLVDLRPAAPARDAVYVVDWRRGVSTLVHTAPNGTYEGALAVLAPHTVLFLRRDRAALELCTLELPADASASAPPSLRVVRTLALPPFRPDVRVHTAYMQTDPPRTHTHTSTPDALPFRSAAADRVVGVTFLLRARTDAPQLPAMGWTKAVLTIAHAALARLVDEATAGADGAKEAEGEEVPWAAWGPRGARVLVPGAFQWITAHAGQRWLALEGDALVVRDFSAARVGARAPAAEDDDDTRALRACFAQDVVSALPFRERRVRVPGREGATVLSDGERLVAFVRMAQQPPVFEVHVLDGEEEEGLS